MRQGVSKILPQAWEIWQERQKRLPQSEVSALVKEATAVPIPHPAADPGGCASSGHIRMKRTRLRSSLRLTIPA
jgi:hypothetical protein